MAEAEDIGGGEAPDAGAAPDTGAADPIAAEAPQEGTQASEPQAFPENWRERIAGDNEALLNQLARFSDPSTFGQAYYDTRKSISDGTYRRGLPENPSEDEMATWREEQGIPAEPALYELDLGEYVLPEGDEELVEAFKGVAHNVHLTPTQFNEAIKWYLETAETEGANIIAADEEFKQAGIDALREEWGNVECRANLNAIRALLDSQFPELGKALNSSRYVEDNNVPGNNPALLKELAQLAVSLNPVATIPIPNANTGTDVVKRYQELLDMSATDRKNYEKHDGEMKEIIAYLVRANLIDDKGNLINQ